MAKERINIIGKRFGRLVVLKYSHNVGYSKYFLCQCDCGNKKTIAKSNLTTGKQVSCGCYRTENLVKSNKLPNGYSRLSKIYNAMKKRCYDPSSNRYHRYGARGIKICDEWLNNKNSFREWAINHGYKDGLTIDRIDNNGNYCPENCRWVTRQEQSNNTCRTVMIEYNGKAQTLTQWAHELNIPTSTLHNRLRVHGWDVEKAFTTPVRGHR